MAFVVGEGSEGGVAVEPPVESTVSMAHGSNIWALAIPDKCAIGDQNVMKGLGSWAMALNQARMMGMSSHLPTFGDFFGMMELRQVKKRGTEQPISMG